MLSAQQHWSLADPRPPQSHLGLLRTRQSKHGPVSVVRAAKTAVGRLKKAAGDEEDASPAPVAPVAPRGPPAFKQQISLEVIEQLKARAQAQAQAEAQDQVIDTDPESDRKRTGFHRVLLNSANQGMMKQAEQVLQQMADSGLEPGPRAWHVLVFAYVRGKDMEGALSTARRATDSGVQLLPETYTILIYGDLQSDPPRVERARALHDSMRAAEANPAQGWGMLCKELFRKKFTTEALEVYEAGALDGYPADPDLYERAITQLAETRGKDVALAELERMVAQGLEPGPDHYTPVIKAWALTGDVQAARAFMVDCFERFRGSRPSIESFNVLLGGMVARLRNSNPDAQGVLEEYFDGLRVQMLGLGMRPNWGTQKHLCEAFIRIRDSDKALAVFDTMLKSGGRARLLEDRYILSLLVLLASEDRPVDMLNVMKELIDDNYPLPLSASNPIALAGGRTMLTSWIDSHMDGMRNKQSATLLAGLVEEARSVVVVDDMFVGMNDTVCDENGMFLPPTKMTSAELRWESTTAGLPSTVSRVELVRQIKERRLRLPESTKDAQSLLEKTLKDAVGKPVTEKKLTKAQQKKLDMAERDAEREAKQGNKEGKWTTESMTMVEYAKGKLVARKLVTREVFVAKTAYERDAELGGFSANGPVEDDMLSEIMAGFTEEGVSEIVERSDNIEGRDFDAEDEGELVDDEETNRISFIPEDDLDVTVGYLEARRLNKGAGMSVAIELLRCFTRLGGQPSATDFERLVEGATLERNTYAARELAEQMIPVPNRSPVNVGLELSALGALYGRLVRTCVEARSVSDADAVLTKAELFKLPVPDADLELFEVALNGRSRPKTLQGTEVNSILEGSGLAQAEDDVLFDGTGGGGDIDQASDSGAAAGAEGTDPAAASLGPGTALVLAASRAVRLIWEEEEDELLAPAAGELADMDEGDVDWQKLELESNMSGDPELSRADWMDIMGLQEPVDPRQAEEDAVANTLRGEAAYGNPRALELAQQRAYTRAYHLAYNTDGEEENELLYEDEDEQGEWEAGEGGQWEAAAVLAEGEQEDVASTAAEGEQEAAVAAPAESQQEAGPWEEEDEEEGEEEEISYEAEVMALRLLGGEDVGYVSPEVLWAAEVLQRRAEKPLRDPDDEEIVQNLRRAFAADAEPLGEDGVAAEEGEVDQEAEGLALLAALRQLVEAADAEESEGQRGEEAGAGKDEGAMLEGEGEAAGVAQGEEGELAEAAEGEEEQDFFDDGEDAASAADYYGEAEAEESPEEAEDEEPATTDFGMPEDDRQVAVERARALVAEVDAGGTDAVLSLTARLAELDDDYCLRAFMIEVVRVAEAEADQVAAAAADEGEDEGEVGGGRDEQDEGFREGGAAEAAASSAEEGVVAAGPLSQELQQAAATDAAAAASSAEVAENDEFDEDLPEAANPLVWEKLTAVLTPTEEERAEQKLVVQRAVEAAAKLPPPPRHLDPRLAQRLMEDLVWLGAYPLDDAELAGEEEFVEGEDTEGDAEDRGEAAEGGEAEAAGENADGGEMEEGGEAEEAGGEAGQAQP